MRVVFSCLILIAVIALSCESENEYRMPSTLAMVQRLDSMALKAKSSADFPYFTDQLLKYVEANVQGMSYTMDSDACLDVALVLLLKGDNDRCI